jgi:hypothetical protein
VKCYSPNTHIDVGVSAGSVISDCVTIDGDLGAG